MRHLPGHRPALVPGLPAPAAAARPAASLAAGRLRHPGRSALRGLHRATRPGPGCPACSDPGHPSPGQCARCLIDRRLDELMGPPAGPLPPGLQALRGDIATAEHPVTAMRWLTKPSVAPVLSGLAAGRIPLTHGAGRAAAQPGPRPSAQTSRRRRRRCPARDEEMARLEAFPAELIDGPARHRAAAGPAPLRDLAPARRLRSRNNGRPVTRQRSRKIRRLARGAVAFLDWLGARDLTLGSGQRADLDRWLAGEQAAYRDEAGRLVRWARAQQADRRPLAAVRWQGPPAGRSQPAGTPPAGCCTTAPQARDRLAGLPVLLYAQAATAISQHDHRPAPGQRRRRADPPRPRAHPPARTRRRAGPHVLAQRKGTRPSAPGSHRPGCSPEGSPAGRSARAG